MLVNLVTFLCTMFLMYHISRLIQLEKCFNETQVFTKLIEYTKATILYAREVNVGLDNIKIKTLHYVHFIITFLTCLPHHRCYYWFFVPICISWSTSTAVILLRSSQPETIPQILRTLVRTIRSTFPADSVSHTRVWRWGRPYYYHGGMPAKACIILYNVLLLFAKGMRT